MDGNTKLLAAFQVECIEHLEGIRSSLSKLEAHGTTDAAAELDDVFRRAHSLKGASRIVGVSGAEKLAHRLEGLFAQIRQGRLLLDKDVFSVVQIALDAIEDAAVCSERSCASPNVDLVVNELDRIADSAAVPAVKITRSGDLEHRLRSAFAQEYIDYLQGIRSWIENVGQCDHGLVGIEEAVRCAHSLKGAARIASVPTVDSLAERLEMLLSQIRNGQISLGASLIDAIQRALTTIETCVAAPAKIDDAQVANLLEALQQLMALEVATDLFTDSSPSSIDHQTLPASARDSTPAATSLGPVDTVRLSTGKLDRLLQSTGELMTETLKQDLVAHDLHALSREIGGIETHWKVLKKSLGVGRLAPTLDVNRVGHALSLIEEKLQSLSRRARSVRMVQQRSAWSFRLLSNQLQQEVGGARMVPAESVFQGFRKMMRDLARDEGKQIEFQVCGFEVAADRMVLQALKDPVMHALRNAVTHGIERPELRERQGKAACGLVLLSIAAVGNRLTIAIEDDGHGVDLAQIADTAIRQKLLPESEAANTTVLTRMLFQPGFSTASAVTELSGRGIGLSVVKDTVSRLQGEVELQPREGSGTILSISVPLAVSTHRLLLISCQGQTFAIPLYGIESLQRLPSRNLETVEGRPVIHLDGQLTPVVPLAHLLHMDDSAAEFEKETLSLVVLRSGRMRLAVVVDVLLAEREGLIKKLGAPAACLPTFCGGVLLEDGTVALVLNPAELTEGFRPGQGTLSLPRVESAAMPATTILVVDDSFTTRTLETSILETHGYSVRVAVDGLEALDKLRSEKIDLVITDIQMPRLDGFGLLEEMKKDPRLAHIPAIIVSSVDQRSDQQRGLSLGANAYIVKRKFDHQDLLQTIQQIL